MPTAPISLYIDVEPERYAELEVVSRAALEFAAGIRELAYQFDPSFEFRLELLRADEGSNWLKANIRWIRGLGFAKPTMIGIATGATMWFLNNVADKAFDAVWSAAVSIEEHGEQITPDQAEEIATRAAKAAASEVAASHFRQVYRELERDPKITGVGAVASHVRKPALIVPRAEFQIRGDGDRPAIVVGEKRTRPSHGDFVIIRPVLKEGGGMWRLSGPEGEFSARITDEAFLASVLEGKAPVPLAAEIHITADLETDEERTSEGAWRPTARRVIQVHDIRRSPAQPALMSPPR